MFYKNRMLIYTNKEKNLLERIVNFFYLKFEQFDIEVFFLKVILLIFMALVLYFFINSFLFQEVFEHLRSYWKGIPRQEDYLSILQKEHFGHWGFFVRKYSWRFIFQNSIIILLSIFWSIFVFAVVCSLVDSFKKNIFTRHFSKLLLNIFYVIIFVIGLILFYKFNGIILFNFFSEVTSYAPVFDSEFKYVKINKPSVFYILLRALFELFLVSPDAFILFIGVSWFVFYP